MNVTKYEPIASRVEMELLARQMIEYSEQNHFDPKCASDEYFKKRFEGKVQVELKEAGMICVHGPESIYAIKCFNKFIFWKTPLQLTYVEMDGDGLDEVIVQLTIVDNLKNPLDRYTVEFIAEFFINLDQPLLEIETPPHVSVIVQKK